MTVVGQGAPAVHSCAHRGDSSRYRENTLPAIRSAIEAEADFVEVDVRVTADGQVVLLHDPSPLRLWGLDGDVAELTWERLRALGDGATSRDAAGSSKGSFEVGSQYRIPLLSDALPLFRGSSSTFLIDMEEADPAEPAYRVVAGSGANVAWCGHIDGMRAIRRLDPAARIWMPWARASAPTPSDIGELNPEYVNAPFLSVTSRTVREIHDLGYEVAVWTVDDEHSMRWAIEMGVDSVTTNRLGNLQRIIDKTPTGSGQDRWSSSSIETHSMLHKGGIETTTEGAERIETTAVDSQDAGLDLDAVLETATELGRWAIGMASSTDPGVISTKKGPADLVTEVDVAVERHVRDVVGRRFPQFGFVGEEMGGQAEPGVPCWYLDPVDGTTNFANRVPWNAFSLALALDDTPLIGVVADPWRGDLFEAVRGRGAKLNGIGLAIPEDAGEGDPLSGRVVSTELAGHLAWPGMLGMLDALGQRDCTMRIMGSGTMTLVGVAAGRGVGSVIGSFGPVDHLAALLIVAEAGGVVLDTRGEPSFFPESGGILAAAPHAASTLYDLWQAALP